MTHIKKFVKSINNGLWEKHIKNSRMRQQSMRDKHEFDARSYKFVGSTNTRYCNKSVISEVYWANKRLLLQ